MKKAFLIPVLRTEKLQPENPGQKQQIRPSGLWRETIYIPLPEKVRPENSAASNYRNGRKIPGRNIMSAIALYTQGCSGTMVEYLVHNLKVEGPRPACAQIFFRYTAGKFRWCRKLNRKFRPTCQNFFFLYVRIELGTQSG